MSYYYPLSRGEDLRPANYVQDAINRQLPYNYYHDTGNKTRYDPVNYRGGWLMTAQPATLRQKQQPFVLDTYTKVDLTPKQSLIDLQLRGNSS